jgi:hypothetical protein
MSVSIPASTARAGIERTRLHAAHIAEEAVKTRLFMPPAAHSLEASILEAARAYDCSTAVGRRAFSWLKDLFQAHVAAKLIEQADDLTLWIVRWRPWRMR